MRQGKRILYRQTAIQMKHLTRDEVCFSGTEEENKKTKLSLYSRYHKALMGYFNDGRLRDDAYENLRKQDFIKKLEQNQGIRLTPYGTDFLSTGVYNHWIEEDFNAFMD